MRLSFSLAHGNKIFVASMLLQVCVLFSVNATQRRNGNGGDVQMDVLALFTACETREEGLG